MVGAGVLNRQETGFQPHVCNHRHLSSQSISFFICKLRAHSFSQQVFIEDLLYLGYCIRYWRYNNEHISVRLVPMKLTV